MPRPLIIKVEDHKSQPNKKATGSIDVHLMKGVKRTNVYENYNFENENSAAYDEQFVPPEEGASRSIVRSLISRYESSTAKANLIKYKSKSMADLQKPQISVAARGTQDDFLFNKNKYNKDESENQKFDFKKVFLKFEASGYANNKTSPTANHSVHQIKSKPYNYDLDLSDIKRKAKMLLETRSYYGYDVYVWQSQVVELLQEIESLGSAEVDQGGNSIYEEKSEEKSSPFLYREKDMPKKEHLGSVEVNQGRNPMYEQKSEEVSPLAYKEESKLKRAQSLDSGELSKNLKVRDIRNIFEAKVDATKPISRSISSYSAYFGIKTTDEDNAVSYNEVYSQPHANVKKFNGLHRNESESDGNEDLEFEEFGKSIDINSDVIEGNRVITQPVLAPSMKIQELMEFFETESDKYVPYQELVQNENDKPDEIDDADFKSPGNSSDSSPSAETEDIHVVENRMLPPPKIVVLNDQTDEDTEVENCKQKIEELTKDIADYEHKIANLSEGDEDEGSYLNEVLVRILIKLDEMKTYGNEVILTERRKAIQFVQGCIKKLREKVRGNV